MDGAYDIRGVCFSVPCIVGANGVEQVIRGRLNDDESSALRRSADLLRQTLTALDTSAADAAAADVP